MASLYAEVIETLREDILSGRLKAGQRLPAERALCERFGVARVTIRRALRCLAEERLISRHQGSGTYVAPNPARRIPLMIDYTGSMRQHAPSLRRKVLLWKWQPAGPEAAADLEIDPAEELLYAERVDIQGKCTVAWDKGYISAPFAKDLSTRELSRVDFVEVWCRKVPFVMESCCQTVDAVGADAACVRHLGLKRGHPVLRSMEIYYAKDARPAGRFVSFYHPEHVSIFSRFRWDTLPQEPKPRRK